MAPGAGERADTQTGLEEDRLQSSREQMRGGGQADRPSTDDGHRQLSGAVGHRRRATGRGAAGTHDSLLCVMVDASMVDV